MAQLAMALVVLVASGLMLRTALALSINLVAIRLGLEVGVEPVVEEARRYGITTPVPRVPSIFIGSADVIPKRRPICHHRPAHHADANPGDKK